MFSIFSQKPELGCYLQSLPEQQLEDLKKKSSEQAINEQAIKDIFKNVDLASSFNYFAPQEGWWIIKKWTFIVNLVLCTLNSEKFFDERKSVIVGQIQSRVNSVWETLEYCAKKKKLMGEIASTTEALQVLRNKMVFVDTQLSLYPPFQGRKEESEFNDEVSLTDKEVTWAKEESEKAEKEYLQASFDWHSAHKKHVDDKRCRASLVKKTEGEVAELLSKQQKMSIDSVDRDKLDQTLKTAEMRLSQIQLDYTMVDQSFERLKKKHDDSCGASFQRLEDAIETSHRMLSRQKLVLRKADLFKKIGSEELQLQDCQKRLQDLEMSYRK